MTVVHQELTMADRTDLIGHVEAEPIVWELHDDGWLTVTLDDGVMLELDPGQVAKVRAITRRRFLPVLGEVA